MIRTVMCATVVLGVLLTGPASAQAAPTSHLTLTYLAQAGYADVVKLTCDPTGGPHPEAAKACALMSSTGGNPAKIKPAQVMCIMLWAPVTAQLAGTWRGRAVSWSHRYGNTCEMIRATGVLFEF
jgi:hypothetical protein